MHPIRTDKGYRAGNVEIDSSTLSPRTAQYAALAIGHGHSCKEAARLMGISVHTAKHTAQRLYWKLGVSNIRQATAELYKRGLIKHLCAVLLIAASHTSPVESSDIYRRAPRKPGTNRVHRRQRDSWLDELIDSLQPQ